MSPSRTIAVASLFVCALAANAQKVTLRINPPVGAVYKYALETAVKQSIQGMNMDMTQKSTMTSKILSNSGGKIKMENVTSNVKIILPKGSPMEANRAAMESQTKDVKSTATLDSRGTVLSTKVTGGNQMMQNMMGSMSGPLGMYGYPVGPIGPGSKWTVPFDFAKLLGSMAAGAPGMKFTGGKTNIAMLVKRIEKTKGKRIAVVDMDMTVTMGMQMGGASARAAQNSDIKMTMKGTMWIDVATGMPTESKADGVSTTSFGTNKMNQTMKITMKLVN